MPYALTMLVLLGLLGDRTLLRSSPAQADAYHAGVKAAVEKLPRVNGNWLGVDVPVPEAAIRMLQPNVILSRHYRNIETGESVSFLLVHVKQARDTLGHYPPVCYPGQGWTTQVAAPADYAAAGQTVINGTRYEFHRERLDGNTKLFVDNFFALRGGETCRDMTGIEQAAQDRQRKLFGAAQIQFVHQGSTSEQRRREIVEDFVRFSEPVLSAIRGGGKKDGK